MNKTIKTNKKRALPFPYFHLAVAVVLTLVILGGIIFVSSQLADLAEKTETSRGQLVALRERETALFKLTEDFRSLEPEIVIISKALPNERGIVDFVRSFKEIAGDVSVEVFNFETDQPVVDANGNAYIGFSVESKSSFENLKVALGKLVGLPYLVRLRIVDIFDADKEEAKMILGARIFVSNDFFE